VLVDCTGGSTRIDHSTPGLVKRRCSNGTTEVLQFNDAGQLEASLRYRNGRFGQPEGWAVRYGYTPEGDLVQVADSERGTTQYEVDGAHRLVAEHAPDGREYVYFQDAAGNVLSSAGIERIEVDTGNRLRRSSEETFVYDSRDRLTERTGRDGVTTRYYYDSFDMLVRVERSERQSSWWPPRLVGDDGEAVRAASSHPDAHWQSWTAEYDAIGRRLSTQCAERQRHFHWDGDRLAAELSPDGRLRIYQYASSEAWIPLVFTDYPSRDATPDTGRTYHVFSNPVGTPLRIEDADGTVVWCAERVDPYGFVERGANSKIEYDLRWPGHYLDADTGLHYNRYRYYDARLGKYLQSDPIGHEGSPINLYAYCPNPLVQVDLLGLDHPNKPAPSAKDGGSDVDGQEGPATRRGLGGGTKPADRVLHQFDAGAREAASLSPTLNKQLDHLDQLKWQVKRGPSGGGSYADKRNRVIVIDGALSGPQATGVIAHEVGHATYHEDPYVPPEGLTRDQYTAANVDRHLNDEGNAQFNAARVRDEIRRTGGPDTGIPGAHEADYQSAYDSYKSGDITQEEALDRMARTMGNESTSTTGENYRDYYGRPYVDHFDGLSKGMA
jgi:RHS repeat-associated protein